MGGAADVASAAAPRGGRPRSVEADKAIVHATLELLGEVGPTGLTVEEVASRAGVSKATLYRRYPGKDQLIVDALASLNADLPVEVPDVGSTRDTLVLMLDTWRAGHATSLAGRLFPRVTAHARTNPPLFGCFYDRVIEPRRELFRLVLRRGIDRGELRGDVDIELAVTLLIAPTLYQLQLTAGGRDPAPGAGSAEFVDAVLDGLTPRG